MKPNTTAKKVAAYRVLVQGFRVMAIVFVILGFLAIRFAHVMPALLFFTGATILISDCFCKF